MPENRFQGIIAERYDADSPEMFEPAVLNATVDFLAALAGDGPALEFAIGTGRIALPLSERGTPVRGIDISADMVAQLTAKRGSSEISVTIGDIATTRVDGTYTLVYLVYNTITNLLTQDEQVECFRNAARHLAPGGAFVIECFLPDLRRLPPGQTVRAFTVTPERLGFDEYDFAAQRLVSHHYWLTGETRGSFQSPHRWAWPAEMDLMAKLAGMSLHGRWADWNREPFTGESPKHISVWQKPPA